PGGEVLLVPEQHVDERNERAIHARGCLDAALRLPQRRPVVEVVRDDDAVAMRRLDRLERDRRRRLRQCAEHTARVSQRTPSAPKRRSQSTSPGFSCDAAECPRSEHPTAPRTPNPRSVKLSPLRTSRPTPSYARQTSCAWSTPP